MRRCGRPFGAGVAFLLVATGPLAACGSDDGDDQSAGESVATTTTTEATTTSAPGVPAEDVMFDSADGVELAGRIYGDGTTAIVASHQANRSKADFASSGPLLAASGFTVLAYDGRGDGASGPGDPAQRVQDTIAAIDLVRSRGATKVFLLGASRGGALSLNVAMLTPVDGVITLSAPPPAEGPAAVAAVTVPSLYVNSENDDLAESTQAMYDVANEPRELQMYAGGGHGVALFNSQPDLVERIAAFVARTEALEQHHCQSARSATGWEQRPRRFTWPAAGTAWRAHEPGDVHPHLAVNRGWAGPPRVTGASQRPDRGNQGGWFTRLYR